MKRLSRQCMSTQMSARKVVPFLLADIGEGISEVEMMQWFVREGDVVKQFDRICEVQSDKATVEISSRYDGVIKSVHHAVGSIVKVGSALVDIELEEQAGAMPTMNNLQGPGPSPSPSPPSPQALAAPSASLGTKDMTPMRGGNVVLTTPAVRRVAKEHGVDLSMVRGTGPDGRILKGDVLEFVKSRSGPLNGSVLATAWGSPPAPPAAPVLAAPPLAPAPPFPETQQAAPVPLPLPPSPFAPPPGPLSISMAPVATPAPAPTPALATRGAPIAESHRVPVRGIMRQMVKSMTASLKIPHFGYQDEVEMDRLVELRQALKPMVEAQGLKLSYLPLMVKAASLALSQFPVLNSSLSGDETEVVVHADHNVGVAMDTPKGLLVPVLRRVQDKSVLQIAAELNELQRLAAAGAFAEEHLTGATFSLSNIGSIGGTYMAPKIVPPQVAIGAVGRIRKVPRFGEDGVSVVAAHVMAVSWAGDHRVIDGATMARFSNAWKGFLENPASMLAQLK